MPYQRTCADSVRPVGTVTGCSLSHALCRTREADTADGASRARLRAAVDGHTVGRRADDARVCRADVGGVGTHVRRHPHILACDPTPPIRTHAAIRGCEVCARAPVRTGDAGALVHGGAAGAAQGEQAD
jgi:hypothetical protein